MNLQQYAITPAGFPIDKLLKNPTLQRAGNAYMGVVDKTLEGLLKGGLLYKSAEIAKMESDARANGISPADMMRDPKFIEKMTDIAMMGSINSPVKVNPNSLSKVLDPVKRVTGLDPVSEVGTPDNIKKMIAGMRDKVDNAGKLTGDDVKAIDKALKATEKYKQPVTNTSIRDGFEDMYARADRVNAGNYKDVVDDVAEPLINEARKYKSAEEFVNSKATALRQGKLDKSGGYFSTGEGGSTYFDELNPNAKFYDISNAKVVISDTAEAKDVLKQALRDPTNSADDVARIKESLNDGFIDYRLNDEVPSIVKAAKKQGYDGIKVWENDSIDTPDSVFIWNTDKVKTKSQLTDIWNKANKK